eukprot:TRINITY_DN10389_c0_g1_i1.p1 TRINITY_DN10389_c0_g1~~TRINITY_DN10389_c0_g1_i1.p1  ORF type:complete len:771 (-),score=115.90 TRINITY_DN10389_c0_g1_i1:228-2480(-)
METENSRYTSEDKLWRLSAAIQHFSYAAACLVVIFSENYIGTAILLAVYLYNQRQQRLTSSNLNFVSGSKCFLSFLCYAVSGASSPIWLLGLSDVVLVATQLQGDDATRAVTISMSGSIFMLSTYGLYREACIATTLAIVILFISLAFVSDERENAAELRKTVQALESATAAKSEFLATVSHEIRTPLGGILGMAQLLYDSSLNQEQRDHVCMILTAGKNLLRLVDDVLDFSKIEAGQLRMESIEFRLQQAVFDVVELLSVRIKGTNVHIIAQISPDIPEYVRGDPVRVQQILINLIGNAIKFTAEGDIVVRVMLAPENDELFLFEVQDTGIGIDEATSNRLFTAFTQADPSTQRRYGGTGLGLSICKKLTAMMGGSIGVKSNPGVGSVFWFTVRLETIQDTANEADPVSVADVERTGSISSYRGERSSSGRNSISRTRSADAIQRIDRVDITRRSLYSHFSAPPTTNQDPDVQYDESPEPPLSAPAEQPRKKSLKSVGFEPVVTTLIPATPPMPLAVPPSLRSSFSSDSPRTPVSGYASPRLSISEAWSTQLGSVSPDQFLDAVDNNGTVSSTDVSPSVTSVSSSPMILPISAPRSSLSPQRLSLSSDNSVLSCSARVLLADDDPINRKVAEKHLTNLGCTVTIATDGLQAVQALQQDQFDMVFMDCHMPRLDGLDATRQIRRERPELKSMPIIALTADAMVRDKEKCIDAGMNAVLVKPVQRDTLRDTVSAWMLQKQLAIGESTVALE